MSWPAVTWAMGQRTPSSASKFLLVVLADSASIGDWLAWPSVAYLAQSTQQDRKTVIANLRKLQDSGLIHPHGHTGRTQQISVWRLPVVSPNDPRKGTKTGTVSKRERVPNSHSNSTSFPSKESQKRDTEPVIEPVSEPPIEPHGSLSALRTGAKPTLGTQDAVLAHYNRILGPYLPEVRLWSADRRKHLNARWQEIAHIKKWQTTTEGVEWFARFFNAVLEDDFLMGRTGRSAGHEGWECTIDFLLSPKGFRRVVEGVGRRVKAAA